MRAVKMFFTGTTAAVVVAIVACGGSSAVSQGTTDSGTSDGSTQPVADSSFTDSPAEASGDASDGACEFTDADLNTATPADAALNDAGASVGTCLSCAQTHCQTQVTACNGDCACENVFSCAFDCLSSIGGTFAGCYIQCGGSLSGANVDPVERALGICALNACRTQCALCSISAKLCPADAGTDAAEAGQTDAAGDATGE